MASFDNPEIASVALTTLSIISSRSVSENGVDDFLQPSATGRRSFSFYWDTLVRTQ